jgi:hypothetical protein
MTIHLIPQRGDPTWLGLHLGLALLLPLWRAEGAAVHLIHT